MAGEINFGLSDPNAAFTGASHTNALLKSFAQQRAGKMLASGDTQGAMGTLQSSGDIAGAQQVQTAHWAQDDRVKALKLEQQKESAQFAADASSALWNHMQQHKTDPDGGTAAVLQGFDQIAPVLKSRGATDADIGTYRTQLASDPAQFLQLMHNEATSHLKGIVVGKDAVLADPSTGKVMTDNNRPDYKIVRDGDGTEHLVAVGGGAGPGSATGAATAAVPGGAPGAPPKPEDVFGAVVAQESGGRAGVTGPHTAYGQAQGEAQLLPATAQAMAKKLGVPWKPELMTAKTPEGEAYQLKLGREYFQEGLDKYNGDVPKALAYYHGGPDESLWGPKTHKYVTDVLGRLEPSQIASTDNTGAGGVTHSPAAGTVPINELFTGKPKPVVHWETRTAQQGDPNFRPGTTFQVNATTGETRKLQDPLNPNGGRNGGGKLSQSENAQLAKLRTQVNETQTMAGLLDQFVTLNKEVQTGGSMAMPGVGTVMSAFNPKVARMKAITDQITPAMRNGLPGAASDRDVAMFRGATVGLDKPIQTNQAIASASKAFAARQGDYLSFLEAYAKQNGTLLGSSEPWKAYVEAHPLYAPGGADGMLRVNKVTPWREAIKLDSAAPASGPRNRTYDPATGAFH